MQVQLSTVIIWFLKVFVYRYFLTPDLDKRACPSQYFDLHCIAVMTNWR